MSHPYGSAPQDPQGPHDSQPHGYGPQSGDASVPSAPSYGSPAAAPTDGSSNGAPTYGSPAAPSYGSPNAAPASPYGQQPGGPAVPPTAPPKKRWPLWVALGCGCLLLLGLALLALIFGVGALNAGSDDESTTPVSSPVSSSSPAGSSSPASSSAAPSDPATSQAAGAPADADVDQATQRYYQFIMAIDTGDYTGACRLTLAPGTDSPMGEADVAACAQSLEGQGLEKGQASGLTESDFEGTAQADGTVKVTAAGTEMPFAMTKATDGQWYVSLD